MKVVPVISDIKFAPLHKVVNARLLLACVCVCVLGACVCVYCVYGLDLVHANPKYGTLHTEYFKVKGLRKKAVEKSLRTYPVAFSPETDHKILT